MTAYRVGQDVICIDDADTNPLAGAKEIERGKIYTLRWVGPYAHPWFGETMLCVRLAGVERLPPLIPGAEDLPFRATRFRPLDAREIEVFTAMLNGEPAAETAER